MICFTLEYMEIKASLKSQSHIQKCLAGNGCLSLNYCK